GVTDPVPNEALSVAEDVAHALPAHPEGKPVTVKKRLYEVDGTDQDWHRQAHGTVALLAEIASWPPPVEAKQRDAVVRWGAQIWQALAKRFLEGPSISVHADSAVVSLDEQKLNAGENWTPRPRDHLTARFTTAGPHTLVFEKEGKRWSRNLNVGKK